MNAPEIITRRLDPMEAEVWVRAPGEVAGRFMGPRNLHASTIEVAYYLQSPRRDNAFAGKRVVIPEPSLWSPSAPMLYEAVLTIDGKRVSTRHGLRRLETTPHGLRLNQKPFEIHSIPRDRIDEAEMRALREQGVNTIVCPVNEANRAVWDMADRIGMLVVGVLAPSSQSLALARLLDRHASSLGWQDMAGATLALPGFAEG